MVYCYDRAVACCQCASKTRPCTVIRLESTVMPKAFRIYPPVLPPCCSVENEYFAHRFRASVQEAVDPPHLFPSLFTWTSHPRLQPLPQLSSFCAPENISLQFQSRYRPQQPAFDSNSTVFQCLLELKTHTSSSPRKRKRWIE